MENIALIAVVSFLALGYLRKGAYSQKLRVIPMGLSVKSGKLYTNVKVLNPTNSNFNIDSIVGDIVLQGRNVGTVRMMQRITIRANSEQDLSFIVNIQAATLLSNISNSVAAGSSVKSMFEGAQVKLTINAEGYPFDVVYNLA